MAKKKAAPAKPKYKRSGRVDRQVVIVLKGTNEYATWLTDAARRGRMPAAVVVEVALAEWAARHGIGEPPMRLGGKV